MAYTSQYFQVYIISGIDFYLVIYYCIQNVKLYMEPSVGTNNFNLTDFS